MKLNICYFSPTGTTRKVIQAIASNITDVYREFDLTLPNSELQPEFDQNDLLLIATPVYAGRVPLPFLERLDKLCGDKTKVVVIAVYGNRHYDEALLELSEFTNSRGFVTIAAASFIGLHSYSTRITPIAVGRPNSSDLKIAEEFGKEIRKRFEDAIAIEVPGKYPMRERNSIFTTPPQSDRDRCTRCGKCIINCPVGAIGLYNDELFFDINKCLFCHSCVRICPENAISIVDEKILEFGKKLSQNCAKPRSPELFL